MHKIKLQIGEVSLIAELRNTPTASEIYNALPIQSNASIWGDEVYFAIPVQVQRESDARDIVSAGELAYWVEGHSIAIGFGPTPISQGNEIRLAARTNIWADTHDDVNQLKSVNADDNISIEAYD